MEQEGGIDVLNSFPHLLANILYLQLLDVRLYAVRYEFDVRNGIQIRV